MSSASGDVDAKDEETHDFVETDRLGMLCEDLENLWTTDKLLQFLGFGQLALSDALKHIGEKFFSKLTNEVGYKILDNRAILRFWLFLSQWRRLLRTTRDKQIEDLTMELQTATKPNNLKSDSLRDLTILRKKLDNLITLRLISKLQAIINLVFQPLDILGYIARSSSGYISNAQLLLLDRGACTCWFLVEFLEVCATYIEIKHQMRNDSRLFWMLLVRRTLPRFMNMILARNWAKAKPNLSDGVIGTLGTLQVVMDVTTDM
mmetsp:Transcript_25363/g.35402  ORF Transcript_25363/g.35402 Transcript_25363/m.35402 type:complete len:262 (-) Transcript_25363:292-1077(-)|eukprot:CAMPEP_0185261090 /NCGR_PEP_ID=MMETSP1359-20130426/9552_1 /TAXON_ID=552665 /ORGANISM="Bigelowiella longifila, Strain CCMP242" /LENGTH=261 /DNA_ID=CAMNT_0027847583 /DNA_START=16 /DNA_END=801 /DNA_ORIENTATION=+